jgi:hypothetical protein
VIGTLAVYRKNSRKPRLTIFESSQLINVHVRHNGGQPLGKSRKPEAKTRGGKRPQQDEILEKYITAPQFHNLSSPTNGATTPKGRQFKKNHLDLKRIKPIENSRSLAMKKTSDLY